MLKLSTILYGVGTVAFILAALSLGGEIPLIAIGLAAVAGGLTSAALGK